MDDTSRIQGPAAAIIVKTVSVLPYASSVKLGCRRQCYKVCAIAPPRRATVLILQQRGSGTFEPVQIHETRCLRTSLLLAFLLHKELFFWPWLC